MNCFNNGKFTEDSCFGCDIESEKCDFRNMIQWRFAEQEKPIPHRRLVVEDSDGMILIARFMNNLFLNIEHDEFHEKSGWSGRVIENVVKWKYI